MTGASRRRDWLIIRELEQDPRQSNVALAKKVGISEGAVRRRIDKLVGSGHLRFVAVPDAAFMGRTVHAMIRVQSAPGTTDRLLDDLIAMPELSYVYHCTGQFDLTLVGYFRSSDELRDFTTGVLGAMDGVVEIRTLMVLRIAKRSHDWVREDLKLLDESTHDD